MNFDLDEPIEGKTPTRNTSQTSANQARAPQPRTNKETLLNESLSSSTSDLDTSVMDFGNSTEIELLFDSSPEKPARPLRPKTKTFPTTDAKDGMVRILVPITIAGGCVKTKVDEEKRRVYCNDYYARSIEMTKDKDLWERIEKDDFGEEEERPDIIEFRLPSKNQIISLYQR